MSELELLRDQVQQLQEALKVNLTLPNEFGLTPLEESIVRLLVKREIVNIDVIYAALYSDRIADQQPDANVINVHIHKIRRKLSKHGVAIKNRYGVGYYLDKVDRDRLSESSPNHRARVGAYRSPRSPDASPVPKMYTNSGQPQR